MKWLYCYLISISLSLTYIATNVNVKDQPAACLYPKNVLEQLCKKKKQVQLYEDSLQSSWSSSANLLLEPSDWKKKKRSRFRGTDKNSVRLTPHRDVNWKGEGGGGEDGERITKGNPWTCHANGEDEKKQVELWKRRESCVYGGDPGVTLWVKVLSSSTASVVWSIWGDFLWPRAAVSAV